MNKVKIFFFILTIMVYAALTSWVTAMTINEEEMKEIKGVVCGYRCIYDECGKKVDDTLCYVDPYCFKCDGTTYAYLCRKTENSSDNCDTNSNEVDCGYFLCCPCYSDKNPYDPDTYYCHLDECFYCNPYSHWHQYYQCTWNRCD